MARIIPPGFGGVFGQTEVGAGARTVPARRPTRQTSLERLASTLNTIAKISDDPNVRAIIGALGSETTVPSGIPPQAPAGAPPAPAAPAPQAGAPAPQQPFPPPQLAPTPGLVSQLGVVPRPAPPPARAPLPAFVPPPSIFDEPAPFTGPPQPLPAGLPSAPRRDLPQFQPPALQPGAFPPDAPVTAPLPAPFQAPFQAPAAGAQADPRGARSIEDLVLMAKFSTDPQQLQSILSEVDRVVDTIPPINVIELFSDSARIRRGRATILGAASGIGAKLARERRLGDTAEARLEAERLAREQRGRQKDVDQARKDLLAEAKIKSLSANTARQLALAGKVRATLAKVKARGKAGGRSVGRSALKGVIGDVRKSLAFLRSDIKTRRTSLVKAKADTASAKEAVATKIDAMEVKEKELREVVTDLVTRATGEDRAAFARRQQAARKAAERKRTALRTELSRLEREMGEADRNLAGALTTDDVSRALLAEAEGEALSLNNKLVMLTSGTAAEKREVIKSLRDPASTPTGETLPPDRADEAAEAGGLSAGR